MTSEADMKRETTVIPGLSRTSAIQSCPHCQARVDTSEFDPLTSLNCPGCNQVIVVRGMIGQFRLVDVAGKGGMGVVYRAVDTGLDRRVAIKLLRRDHSANHKLIEQLEQEAEITASINHPHVIKVFSTGIDHGRFFIAMELASRGSLEELIRQNGKVQEVQVLDIAIQTAKGLKAAHQHGLIHRDIKPGNILFSDGHTAKIVDFGLAIFLDQQQTSGEIWGTPYYLPPEKLEYRPEDLRSDIYSLGATLYHALAGRPPFEGETATMVALKHVKSQAVSLQAFAPWVSSQTSYIINRTLMKRPRDRYENYDELIQHFEYAKEELTNKVAQTGPRRVVMEDESTKRMMSWMVFGMIAVMLLIVGGAGYALRGSLFKKHSSVSASTPAASDSGFDRAVAELSAGRGANAVQQFQRVIDTRPKQPTLNWAILGKGTAELVAGRPDDSQNTFRKLIEAGLYSNEPEESSLAAFFFGTGKEMSTATPVDAGRLRNLNTTDQESILPLLYGLKNWELGKIDEAAAGFREFRNTSPAGKDAWIADLKGLSGHYLDQLTKFQTLEDRYKKAASGAEKIALAQELRRSPGALGEYAETITANLAADLAAKLEDDDSKNMPDSVPDSSPDVAAAPADSNDAGEQETISDGIYYILNHESGLAFTADPNSLPPPASSRLTLEKLTKSPLQQWRIVSMGKKRFRFYNVQNGLSLHDGYSRKSGAIVDLQVSRQSLSMSWFFFSKDGNTVKIRNQGTGKYVGATGREGSRLEHFNWQTSDSQRWDVVPAN